jgi:hypothetical protein
MSESAVSVDVSGWREKLERLDRLERLGHLCLGRVGSSVN